MVFPGLNMLKKMRNKFIHILLLTMLGIWLSSCSVSKSYPQKYYVENEALLQKMEQTYKKITTQKRIAIAFTDWQFDNVAIELKTDTIRYIYEFAYNEKRVNDTLYRFGYDTSLIQSLLQQMRQAKCTWMNALNYYVDKQENTLVFMAIHAKRFFYNLKTKYYLFNFYEQPQYYDEKGRLLNKKKLRQLRKINNETFWRITDKVCYTISGKFR
jgi:hypothetical protein